MSALDLAAILAGIDAHLADMAEVSGYSQTCDGLRLARELVETQLATINASPSPASLHKRAVAACDELRAISEAIRDGRGRALHRASAIADASADLAWSAACLLEIAHDEARP